MNPTTLFSLAIAVMFVTTGRANTVTNLVVSSLMSQRVAKSIVLKATQTATVVNENVVKNGVFEMVEIIDNVHVARPNLEAFKGQVFYGPSIVEFAVASQPEADGYFTGLITLELTNPGVDPVPITNIPSNAVVIPADSAGPVTILLESSADLITWNSANPGTYGTSSTNRFFRVRAVR